MAKNFFITGTDTDAGKTLITQALLIKAAALGLKTLGLKPVAAGGMVDIPGSDKQGNDDAVKLMAASTEALPYAQVNPVLFSDPIAPHIAAEKEGRNVTIHSLTGFVRGAMMTRADFRLIEGAGGWMVPLNGREPLSALAKELKTPVILVVGMKLGCLNHALLTARAIRADGLEIAGWVGTQIDKDMSCVEENLASLKGMLGAPCLGFVPFQENVQAEAVAEHLDITALL
ncbi:MAG: dethiobiotin synthase [Pseudomonadales bacterium]|nr:dethiobiotin synthase [Pseudomonadales bacterium]